jgi:peptidoglycan/LPS O-acetylase OafA/YrhL
MVAICCQVWTPPGYLTMIAVSMALLPAATVARPRSWAGRILEVPLLAWIGRMSYSLYIWQQLFLPPRAMGGWQRAPWNLAAIFACAAISYYWVERPAIAFGKRLADGRMSGISRERQVDLACSS